jgi:DNA-binding PadR family transcriptional regulator
MEQRGLVTSSAERQEPPAPGLPRRIYVASAKGLEVLGTWERVMAVLAGEEVPT